MALFDSLLGEANERFNLQGKGGALLAALLGLMTNQQTGGFRGFLELFDRAGLGELANSWVARGANTPLSNHQTADALGADRIASLASSVGTPTATTTSALSYMIPAIVDKLTPDGVMTKNDDVLAMIGGYLSSSVGGITENARTVAAAGADRIDAGATALRSDAAGGSSTLTWLLPLLIFGLLGYIGYQFCAAPNRNVATVNANVNRTNANTAAPAAKTVDPRVSIKAEGGKYSVSGVVSSEAEKNQIMEAMRRELGEANVDFANLRVDANAKSVGWLSQFTQLLPSLKGWTGGELTFEGEKGLRAVGSIPAAVMDRIKALFAGWTMPAMFLGTGVDAQKAANEQATQALATADTPQEVVDALNLSIINFATGKSDIPADNKSILQKASEILKTAPAGTTIEVGGHTDNVGNAAANQKLSEERANAVMKELQSLGVKPEMLSAKGYGNTKPKADNTTEQGRFQNRRIEYTLTSGNK